jgi:hypothetical protein
MLEIINRRGQNKIWQERELGEQKFVKVNLITQIMATLYGQGGSAVGKTMEQHALKM